MTREWFYTSGTSTMHIRIGYFEFVCQLLVTICTDERLFTSVYGIIQYNGFIFLEIGCIMWGGGVCFVIYNNYRWGPSQCSIPF